VILLTNPNTLNKDHYARHGGVHFRNNVSAQEINSFVQQLSEDRKETFFEVFNELERAGLITMVNDHVFADGEGNIGGSQDC
jgi:hypothetical protein